MRNEKDILGELSLPSDALYGIHSMRARNNFISDETFHTEWFQAIGIVKLACYESVKKFRAALAREDESLISHLKLPSKEVLNAMCIAAKEIAEGEHFQHFVVPAIQGGAGTSINLNVNEIIANRALIEIGKKPGEYEYIDPIESANIYQSTNDVIPTALVVAIMTLLNTLENSVNNTRKETEELEQRYRNTLRLGFTQLQEAVPSTYGQLFSAYSDALSRDWWRISKAFERIKQVNLGGGATGSGISIPRYFLMEVVNQLRQLTGLPIAQGENMLDVTSNHDSMVEVHAILKAHAVNLEKIVGDLRLLSSGLHQEKELVIPDKQTGSSIMPGKINPVIPEFIISSAHHVYANDLLITQLAGMGQLELNAYIPSMGHAILGSLKLLIGMDTSAGRHLLQGLKIDEDISSSRLYRSPAITTALSPLIGYKKAAQLAKFMKETGKDVFESNRKLEMLSEDKLKRIMMPENLIKKGFTIKDIREYNEE